VSCNDIQRALKLQNCKRVRVHITTRSKQKARSRGLDRSFGLGSTMGDGFTLACSAPRVRSR
jgi:hypothetical protein